MLGFPRSICKAVVTILAVAFAMFVGASTVHADVFGATREISIDSGIFTGDDQVTLLVKNDGINGSGTQLVNATVTESVVNGRSFGNLFIRTWNGSEADLSNQADRQGTDVGSYVRFGSVAQWTLDSSIPAENSQQFSDGQTVYGGARISGTITGGADDTTFQTLAVAVVVPRELVRFDYSLDYANAPTSVGTATTSLNGGVPEFPFPEPTCSVMLGLGLVLIRRRKSRPGVALSAV